MERQTPDQVALWRLAVLGPLISAALEHGDRRSYFEQAAERLYDHPDGRRKVRVSARTIESWYYAHKAGGIEALRPRRRADRNKTTAIAEEIVELIVRAKRSRPSRSTPQIIRLLTRARRVAPGSLSRATVLRVLRRHDIATSRPRLHSDKQRLAFLPENAGDLWIGDAMHGPRVRVDGKLRKSYLISIIDAATRYLVGSSFCLSEGAVDHEAVLKQALCVHGRPRTYYVDQGAAYTSGSLRLICAELGIYLQHTQTRDAQAKGAIERWHRTWRAEVGTEIEGRELTLSELNAIHCAWLGQEYHARIHTTTGRIPQHHLLEDVQLGKPRRLPSEVNVDLVFWHRARRLVRADSTIDLNGRRFEVSALELCGRRVDVRFDPRDPESSPKVYEGNRFLCDTGPLDLHANMRRRRRRRAMPKQEPTTDAVDSIGDILEAHFGAGNSGADGNTEGER